MTPHPLGVNLLNKVYWKRDSFNSRGLQKQLCFRDRPCFSSLVFDPFSYFQPSNELIGEILYLHSELFVGQSKVTETYWLGREPTFLSISDVPWLRFAGPG
jgi:hypothetical protein